MTADSADKNLKIEDNNAEEIVLGATAGGGGAGAAFEEENIPNPIEGVFDDVDPLPKSRKPDEILVCLLYTSPSPRDATLSRMPSSA